MLKKQIITFLIIMATGLETLALDLTLSRFLHQALTNKDNTEVKTIEESFRFAKEAYKKALNTYGFESNISISNSFKGSINDPDEFGKSNSFSFSLNKSFPFLFGNDLSMSISQSFLTDGFVIRDYEEKSHSISLSYTLPISPENIQKAENRAKKDQLKFEDAQLKYISSLEQLVKKLLQQYSTFQGVLKSFESSKKSFDDQQKVLKLAQIKYDLGQISGFELVKARVNKLQEEAKYMESQRQYRNKKKELFRIIGFKRDEEVVMDEQIDIDLEVQNIQSYLNRIKYNKDYQKALRDIEKTKIDYESSITELLPDLKLALTNTGQYSFNFNLNIPLVDKGSLQIDHESARTTYMNQIKSFEASVESIHNEIIDKYNSVIELKEQRLILDIYYKFAQNEYKIAFDNFNQGSATVQDVKQARQSYDEVANNILTNQKELLLAVYDLKILTGSFIRTEDYIAITDIEG